MNGNPLLSEERIKKVTQDGEAMTQKGLMQNVYLQFLLLVLSAIGAVMFFDDAQNQTMVVLLAALTAFVVALIIIFAKRTAPTLAPIYAIIEGIAIGLISVKYEALYDGIIMQAVGLTLLVFFVMLLAYQNKWIRVTNTFKTVMVIGLISISIFYLIAFFFSLAGQSFGFLHDGSWLSIVISIVITIIASLCFALDFDRIDTALAHGAPKHYEAYCAFALMLTIIWVYLEIIRLISNIRKN